MYNLLLILIIYEILFSRVHSVSVLHVCYVRYSIFFLYFGEIFPERKKIITYLTFIAWHYSMWWYIQPPYQPHVFNFVEKNSEFFHQLLSVVYIFERLEKSYVFKIHMLCLFYSSQRIHSKDILKFLIIFSNNLLPNQISNIPEFSF